MPREKYNEPVPRHSFLETQRKDLLDSIENTQASIKEIDDVSRMKFDEAFKVINENFSVTFSKLFGGGQAFMKLTDAENTNESGIDIVASPPGKKLRSEEHTSELQSRQYLVCRLLLEKKKRLGHAHLSSSRTHTPTSRS